MTLIQALNLLAQCAAQAPLPASVHDQWRAAFKVLHDKLKDEDKPKDSEES